MASVLPVSAPITLGNVVGSGSDGVLAGLLTATDPDYALLYSSKVAGICITDDGGTYVDETTPFGESTGDDVEVLPSTPAAEDAVYFGHASETFDTVSMNQTTQGSGTWTITWEYWDGNSWEALAGVTDGTTGFTAATGWVDVTFTVPTDWAQANVDNQYGYYVRARVSAYTSVTTAPQVGQGNVSPVTATYTDDTTDFTDAGAGDVALLPASQHATGDAFLIGYSERFCKVKVTTSQARTGTATITLKYWDGDSWEAVTTVEDDSVGYSATAGTHLIHFVPPSDWTACTAANGPDGNAGYFVKMELTALTDVTQQPLATQGWVFPLATGASGIKCPQSGQTVTVSMDANTVSATNADSVFAVVNTTRGTALGVTWTQALGHDSDSGSLRVDANNELALVQITEDGTTEFADASFAIIVQ